MGIGFVVLLWILLMFAFASVVASIMRFIAVLVKRFRKPSRQNFPDKAFRASFWIVPIFFFWAIGYAVLVDRFGGLGYHIGDSWSVSLSEKYCMYAIDDPKNSSIWLCRTDGSLNYAERVISDVSKLAVTPIGIFGIDAKGPFRFDANNGNRESIENVAELARRLPAGYELKEAEAAYYSPYGWQDAVGRWLFVVALVLLLSFIVRRYVWVR